MPHPTVAQLTQALKLAQKLEEMEAELASILGGSPSTGPTVKEGKRGRPRGSGAKKKRGMSEEGRKRIAEAQRKRWANTQKAEDAK